MQRVAGLLKTGGASPVEGGTIDFAMKGEVTSSPAPTIDLPLYVTLHNTVLHMAGRQQPVDQLELPLGLRGPIDSPAITLDKKKLADALAKSGATQLARDLLKDNVGDENVDGVLSGDKAERDKAIKDAAKNEAKKQLGGLFDRLGGKKDEKEGGDE